MYGDSRGGGFRPRRSFAPVKVGDELDIKVEAVGEKGDGIAKKDGFVLFIPNTNEGDEVKIKVTKVLNRVGFAEVVGSSSGSTETAEEAPSDSEDFGEEESTDEPAEESASDSAEESSDDSEDFGEEESTDEPADEPEEEEKQEAASEPEEESTDEVVDEPEEEPADEPEEEEKQEAVDEPEEKTEKTTE